MFDLEKLRNFGQALKTYGKEQEEYKYPTETSDYEPGGEVAAVKKQREVIGMDLDKEEEQARIESSAKEDKEATDKETDEKIANIKKVLQAFDDQDDDVKQITPRIVIGDKSQDINLRAPDLGQAIAKRNAQQLIAQPTSQKDRVSILLQDIYKTL